jgi:imidazolonepropionase-like amidohydrolase
MPAGATVTTPSSLLPGRRSPPGRCLEHGFRLEPGLARVMTAAGDGPGGDPGRAGVLEQLRGDHPAGPPGLGRGPGGAGRAAGGGPGVGPKLAHGAGVLLCAGTDFGGGWLRANQLPRGGRDTLVAAGLEPYDALAGATVNGGWLLGEPGAGVLAEGPGRLPAGPRRPLLSDPGSRWRGGAPAGTPHP